MTLLDQIRRAHEAKKRGGPDGPTGLALAALLPSAEEIADRLLEGDRDLTHAEALEEGFAAREAALEVMQELLTNTAEEDG